MRSYNVGGRFDSDFESDQISDGITADLTNTVGTIAEWWTFDSTNSVKDAIYDVEPVGSGRVWIGPKTLSVVRATVSEGTSMLNVRGLYNVDTLHLTLNIDDVYNVSPSLFYDRGLVKTTIDSVDTFRIVFKNQVYRPVRTQPAGLVANRHTLVIIELTQLAPDELVNDAQFLTYAQP